VTDPDGWLPELNVQPYGVPAPAGRVVARLSCPRRHPLGETRKVAGAIWWAPINPADPGHYGTVSALPRGLLPVPCPCGRNRLVPVAEVLAARRDTQV
jgi:hypothetical protein